jgi:hypothetical protein
MNIFFIHDDPYDCARDMLDKHIVKMPLESAQILSTAHRFHSGDEYCDERGLYKTAHLNHPSTIWARESKDNYLWLLDHFKALLDEKLRRYPTRPPHKSGNLLDHLSVLPLGIPDEGLTKKPQCMPDEYKNDDVVQAYRNYYCGAKWYIATWKKPATKPEWFREPL